MVTLEGAFFVRFWILLQKKPLLLCIHDSNFKILDSKYLGFIETFKRQKVNPGAPVAGQRGHFRLSRWILRDTEVIATHGFFQK